MDALRISEITMVSASPVAIKQPPKVKLVTTYSNQRAGIGSGCCQSGGKSSVRMGFSDGLKFNGPELLARPLRAARPGAYQEGSGVGREVALFAIDRYV
jgi:hypothetical protein